MYGTGRPGCGQITCPTCDGIGQVAGQSSQGSDSTPSTSNQQSIEEQQKKDQEEAKLRQEAFDKGKEEALKSMKGIINNELGGLKGVDTSEHTELKGVGTGSGDLGLKTLFEKPAGNSAPAVDFRATGPLKLDILKNPVKLNPKDIDSSMVDLSFLDHHNPIVLDPNIVKGKKRVFPAQMDPETYNNVNHNRGLDALLHNEPLLAVKYFEQAHKERPNDPIIRNDLLLAQDLVKVHKQTDEEKLIKSRQWEVETIASLMRNDTNSALVYITAARDLEPNDKYYYNFIPHIQKIAQEVAHDDTPGKRSAYLLVGKAWAFVAQGDKSMAINCLEKAHQINPQDEYIVYFLEKARTIK